MAWVVGLIIPILPVAASVNQRLPSGPAVIPLGLGIGGGDGELGDGVGRRVDHPDLVGCRLGEPEVAVGARRDPEGRTGGRDGELGDGDRQQATILQPFEPGPCPDPVGEAAAGAGGAIASQASHGGLLSGWESIPGQGSVCVRIQPSFPGAQTGAQGSWADEPPHRLRWIQGVPVAIREASSRARRTRHGRRRRPGYDRHSPRRVDACQSASAIMPSLPSR